MIDIPSSLGSLLLLFCVCLFQEYLVGDIGNKMRVILSRDPFRKKYILTLGRPVRREVNSNIRTGYDEMGEKNIIYED